MSNAIRVIPAAAVAVAMFAASAAAVAAPGDAYKRPLTSYQGPTAVRSAQPVNTHADTLADAQVVHAQQHDSNAWQNDRLRAYYGN